MSEQGNNWQQVATKTYTNIIFPRCSSLEISYSRLKVIQSDLKQISPEKLLPMGAYKLKLVKRYTVLIGRILRIFSRTEADGGSVANTHIKNRWHRNP